MATAALPLAAEPIGTLQFVNIFFTQDQTPADSLQVSPIVTVILVSRTLFTKSSVKPLAMIGAACLY